MSRGDIRIFRVILWVVGSLVVLVSALNALDARIEKRVDDKVGALSTDIRNLQGSVKELTGSVNELNRAMGRVEGRRGR